MPGSKLEKETTMNYELHLHDCIDWMNSQEEKSINCIITSPPYNLDIKYGKYEDDLPRESYLKWLHDIAVAMKRVLKDDGQLFLNVGYSNIDPWVAMDVAQVFRNVFVAPLNAYHVIRIHSSIPPSVFVSSPCFLTCMESHSYEYHYL